VATRSVSYSALVYQESEGEPGTVPRAVSAGRSTAEWRVGATVSPLPSFSLRPTATAQLAFWRGIPVDHALGLPPALPSFDRPNSVMLHLAPGAEVALSKDVLLFARADMQLRVAGNRKDVLSTGDTVLIQTSDGPNAAGPLGFDLLVGVELPLGPLFAKGANGT